MGTIVAAHLLLKSWLLGVGREVDIGAEDALSFVVTTAELTVLVEGLEIVEELVESMVALLELHLVVTCVGEWLAKDPLGDFNFSVMKGLILVLPAPRERENATWGNKSEGSGEELVETHAARIIEEFIEKVRGSQGKDSAAKVSGGKRWIKLVCACCDAVMRCGEVPVEDPTANELRKSSNVLLALLDALLCACTLQALWAQHTCREVVFKLRGLHLAVISSEILNGQSAGKRVSILAKEASEFLHDNRQVSPFRMAWIPMT